MLPRTTPECRNAATGRHWAAHHTISPVPFLYARIFQYSSSSLFRPSPINGASRPRLSQSPSCRHGGDVISIIMRRVCLAPASFQEGRLGRDLSAAAARPLHPSSCPSPPPDDAAGLSPCGRRWRRGLAGIWKWRRGAGRRRRLWQPLVLWRRRAAARKAASRLRAWIWAGYGLDLSRPGEGVRPCAGDWAPTTVLSVLRGRVSALCGSAEALPSLNSMVHMGSGLLFPALMVGCKVMEDSVVCDSCNFGRFRGLPSLASDLSSGGSWVSLCLV